MYYIGYLRLTRTSPHTFLYEFRRRAEIPLCKDDLGLPSNFAGWREALTIWSNAFNSTITATHIAG